MKNFITRKQARKLLGINKQEERLLTIVGVLPYKFRNKHSKIVYPKHAIEGLIGSHTIEKIKNYGLYSHDIVYVERLEDYLNSEVPEECSYTYTFNHSTRGYDVLISTYLIDVSMNIYFKFYEENGALLIKDHNGFWRETSKDDASVKYFWMQVSPMLFPNI